MSHHCSRVLCSSRRGWRKRWRPNLGTKELKQKGLPKTQRVFSSKNVSKKFRKIFRNIFERTLNDCQTTSKRPPNNPRTTPGALKSSGQFHYENPTLIRKSPNNPKKWARLNTYNFRSVFEGCSDHFDPLSDRFGWFSRHLVLFRWHRHPEIVLRHRHRLMDRSIY